MEDRSFTDNETALPTEGLASEVVEIVVKQEPDTDHSVVSNNVVITPLLDKYPIPALLVSSPFLAEYHHCIHA